MTRDGDEQHHQITPESNPELWRWARDTLIATPFACLHRATSGAHVAYECDICIRAIAEAGARLAREATDCSDGLFYGGPAETRPYSARLRDLCGEGKG